MPDAAAATTEWQVRIGNTVYSARMSFVYLVDGTYELFRAYFGAPSSKKNGREIAATRALLRSFATMLQDPDVTHIAVAFDTVIESFRNDLFVGYKTGAGIDPDLFSQFPLAERATRALGIVTWSMIEFEADDAIAAFAARAAEDPTVTQVRICTPDKDLCQCVRDDGRVVLYDRRQRTACDVEGVRARLGVAPDRVPSLLALVGDTADGIPGIPRWGEKSAAKVLQRFRNVSEIPDDPSQWELQIRGAAALAAELSRARTEAKLYEVLATLRLDVPLSETVEDLRHQGVRNDELRALCHEIGAEDVLERFKLA
jgi:5'-3' exonuclease